MKAGSQGENSGTFAGAGVAISLHYPSGLGRISRIMTLSVPESALPPFEEAPTSSVSIAVPDFPAAFGFLTNRGESQARQASRAWRDTGSRLPSSVGHAATESGATRAARVGGGRKRSGASKTETCERLLPEAALRDGAETDTGRTTGAGLRRSCR